MASAVHETVNCNADLESKGRHIPTKNFGVIIFRRQAKQWKNTAQLHRVGKGFRRKIWRTEESKRLGNWGVTDR